MKNDNQPALQQNHVTRNGSWEGVHFPLTEEYVTAVENLLKAEIEMMRLVHRDTADCWYCGAAKIKDMSSVGYLELSFGGRDDVEWLASDADVFVTVD